MEQISNPHDKFFKEALSRQEAAVDFVVHYLPKNIASLLNVDSLKISKAVDLLEKAQIIMKACHTDASGLPLGATLNSSLFPWVSVMKNKKSVNFDRGSGERGHGQ